MSLVPWSHMKADISDAKIEEFMQEMMKDIRKGDKIKNILFARHETAGSFVARSLLREYPPCVPQADNLGCQLDLVSSSVTTAFRERHVNSASHLDLSSGCLTATLGLQKSMANQYPTPQAPLFDLANENPKPVLNPKAFVLVNERDFLDKARIGLFGKDKDGKMWLVWISRESFFKRAERLKTGSSSQLLFQLGHSSEGVQMVPIATKQLVSQVLIERFIQKLDYSNQKILECMLSLLQFFEELQVSGRNLSTYEGKPGFYPAKFTLLHEVAYKVLTLMNLIGGLRALNTMVVKKESPSTLGFINPLETELDLIDARTEVVECEVQRLMASGIKQPMNPNIVAKLETSLDHLRRVVLFHLQTLYKNPQQSFLIGPYTIAMQSGQTRAKNFLQAINFTNRGFHTEVLARLLETPLWDNPAEESAQLSVSDLVVTADFAVGWRAVSLSGVGGYFVSRTLSNLFCNALMEKYYLLDNYRQDDHLITPEPRLPLSCGLAISNAIECLHFFSTKEKLFRFYAKM